MNAIETILSRKSIPLMEDPKPSKSQLKKILSWLTTYKIDC